MLKKTDLSYGLQLIFDQGDFYRPNSITLHSQIPSFCTEYKHIPKKKEQQFPIVPFNQVDKKLSYYLER